MGCSSSIPINSPETTVKTAEVKKIDSHPNFRNENKQDRTSGAEATPCDTEEVENVKTNYRGSSSEKPNRDSSAVHKNVTNHPIGQKGNANAGPGEEDQSNELSGVGGGRHGVVTSLQSSGVSGTSTNGCNGVDDGNIRGPSVSDIHIGENQITSALHTIDGDDGRNNVVQSAEQSTEDEKEKAESYLCNRDIELDQTDCKEDRDALISDSYFPRLDITNENQAMLPNQTLNPCASKEAFSIDQSQSPMQEVGDELQVHQAKFSQGLRSYCRLVDPKELVGLAHPHIHSLTLERAPAGFGFPFTQLLMRLTGITELNISGNQIGPQAFRVITLAMSHNRTITSLDISNNQADTDSSECLGKMLSINSTLVKLDVSSNQLGRDYFSRCIGPPLGSNKALKTLRASSCGLSDLDILLDNLCQNDMLEELDISHNQMKDGEVFASKLMDVLKSPTCRIRALHARNCGIRNEGMKVLTEALVVNTTLEKLHVGGNTVMNLSGMISLLTSCIRHPALTVCNISDTGLTSQEPTVPSTDISVECSTRSQLTLLSMANCSLSDDIIKTLANQLPGSLPNLSELDLTGNPAVTAEALPVFITLTGGKDQGTTLQTIHLGSLSIASLPDILQESADIRANLRSLDLRRAKMTPSEVGGLKPLCKRPSGLTNLCLDGLKLSRSEALEELLNPGSSCSIESLSLAGCALQDFDLAPITKAVSEGLAIQTLKLSANRLTDTGAVGLLEAFLARGSECSLSELNFANNRLSDGCAETVSKLISSAPDLHSLLLGHNALSGNNLKTILASLCPMDSSSLRVLDLCSQDSQIDESDIAEVLSLVSEKLGYKIVEEDDTVRFGSSDLPHHPEGLTINLMGLGGSGETGQVLDSLTVKTDYATVQRPWLALQHTLEIADWLKGSPVSECQDGSVSQCSLTSDEWCQVLGLPKDPSVPSWLQVSEHRLRAIYLTGLPGGVSAGKLEGDLESEADCLIQEVCIMKDFILRKPNGIAWVLMADNLSVYKALEFFHEGKALMFSQPYMISAIMLTVVVGGVSEEDATKARLDLEARAQEAARENAEHRALLASSYQASQERHEYAKANPAYADGRIW
ncbi:uncharacterized protein LOC110987760 [Acanthaster planci]|uniref:Uncharacterized protein LOC110987760 n=1 Tax=Acanthaster planci TaxID=133434 RepID=A0A8B7ZLK7_ACAPL|nr:uncharacterized protein LOC110987760 [Acanthaster planci]XP_022106499.1 uncharacterized protein LOC110987760 [Acanthaster planci]